MKEIQIKYEKTEKMIRLRNNCVKDYDWGSTNPNCYVNKLQTSNKKRYAQLWMGMHPNGQSQTENGQKLSMYLKQNKLEQIQFLFKVLSIQKCLSIQLHPDQLQAIELNKYKPEIYVDSNDKPQMFFTLTQFECFLGFISEKDLERLIGIPPFNKYQNKQIQLIIEQILQKDEPTIKQHISILLKNKQQFPQRLSIIKRLHEQFSDDVGIILCCFLNYLIIPKGQCYYISPKTPHAYIHGQCIQLMKNSDNVIRLGLTHKYKDIQTALKVLSIQNNIHKVTKFENKYKIQKLQLYEIGANSKVQIQSISIGIVIQGEFFIQKSHLKVGDSFLLIAKQIYDIQGQGKMYIGSYES